MIEKVVKFGTNSGLIGIITESQNAGNKLPVIILLNAGFIHRIGPNRLHVNLARQLAISGFTSLRFDFSGIGDSPPCMEVFNEEQRIIKEVQSAMDYLSGNLKNEGFILAGLCTGADNAYKVANIDKRIVGIAMINNLFLNQANNSEGIKYSTLFRLYRKKIFDYKSWRRVFSGQTNYLGFIKALLFKVKRLILKITKLLLLIIATPLIILGGIFYITFSLIRRMFNNSLGELKNDVLLKKLNKYNPFKKNKLKNIENQNIVNRDLKAIYIFSEGSESYEIYKKNFAGRAKQFANNNSIEIKLFKKIDHVFSLSWSQKELIDYMNIWLNKNFK